MAESKALTEARDELAQMEVPFPADWPSGMTLWDHFAGQALARGTELKISDDPHSSPADDMTRLEAEADTKAWLAYLQADAMLKERSRA